MKKFFVVFVFLFQFFYVFAAKIPNNVKYNIQKEEVLKLEFLKVENDDDINNLQLAFDSAKKILKNYLKNKDKV